MTIDKQLAAAREESGLSIREAADKLGVSAAHLEKLETGYAVPSVVFLFVCCGLYGTTFTIRAEG